MERRNFLKIKGLIGLRPGKARLKAGKLGVLSCTPCVSSKELVEKRIFQKQWHYYGRPENRTSLLLYAFWLHYYKWKSPLGSARVSHSSGQKEELNLEMLNA